MGLGAVAVSVIRVAVAGNRQRVLLPFAAFHGYGAGSSSRLSTMRAFPLLALSLLTLGVGSASAMEPVQIQSRGVEASAPAPDHAAVSQEQASLDASCRELRAQAVSVEQPLLEQGPRHPRTSPLLSVGF